MTQVIIYQNQNAPNVCLCAPTGEISIQEVLLKDCPSGAIIVDRSTLPQDHTYFDAWRLVDGVVVVDIEAAKQIGMNSLNAWASSVAAKRATDEAIGVKPLLRSEDFIAVLDDGRAKIESADSTQQITSIVEETERNASA